MQVQIEVISRKAVNKLRKSRLVSLLFKLLCSTLQLQNMETSVSLTHILHHFLYSSFKLHRNSAQVRQYRG